MKQYTYNVTSSVVFGLVALFHLVRAIWQWPVIIYGYSIGIWVSVIVFIVTALLSYYAVRLASKMS